MTAMYRVATWLVAAGLAMSATAHEGEDHSAPAALERAADVLPRATASTEDFELVAVLGGAQLLIYLDRYRTNEPVSGARVEVESGALKADAAEREPGVYALAAPALAAPGRHAITVAIEAGESVDLLSATLEVAGDAAAALATDDPRKRLDDRIVWGGIGAIVLAGAGWFAARTRQRRIRTELGNGQ